MRPAVAPPGPAVAPPAQGAEVAPEIHEDRRRGGVGQQLLGHLHIVVAFPELTGQGHGTRKIADMLRISVKTVETHRANLMRKFTDATGVTLGPSMEEALRRMEAGEDPEQVEAEMGDLLEEEEPFIFEGKKGRGIKRAKPRRDETLYEL